MIHFTYATLSKPYDIFWLYHLKSGNKVPENLHFFIKQSTVKLKRMIFLQFLHFPKSQKNKPDDWVYENFPE